MPAVGFRGLRNESPVAENPERTKALSFISGVGQNIALGVSPAPWNSALLISVVPLCSINS